MGRPKKVLSPMDEAERRLKKREADRERVKRRREDPEFRARTAEAKRQRRAEDPELWARKVTADRQYDSTHRQERRLAAQQRRASDPGLRVLENFRRRERLAATGDGPRLLLPSPAAEHASSITWASHLAGKGNSFTQCGVPVECKSSQADFKPKSRSVGAQTQHRKNTSADSVHRKGAAAAGVSAVRRSRPKAADIALRLWEELQSRRSATDP
ncbi:uncharacterized protein LOC144145880 isoform X3 [Haemaphysalis longicornis]